MCEGWENANSLRAIFTHFENIVTIPEDEKGEKFNIIGFNNQIWTGFKTTLIKNEDFYILWSIINYNILFQRLFYG